MIFFTFAMLLFHPALEKGYLNNIAKRGLAAAEWMIFVFSILFVLYSVNAFLKSRNKEFCQSKRLPRQIQRQSIHLQNVGAGRKDGFCKDQPADDAWNNRKYSISPGQLRKLITAENIIIGVLSIVSGIIGGLIFSKTTFTARAPILEMGALPLYLPWEGLALTVACWWCKTVSAAEEPNADDRKENGRFWLRFYFFSPFDQLDHGFWFNKENRKLRQQYKQ